MSPRETQNPDRAEKVGHSGETEVVETHPAFGLARFNRYSVSSPGQVLFDSEIRHSGTISFKVSRAQRTRMLNHDYHFGYEEILEIEMSEAQFGALVSSFGNGSGVPVTIRRTESEIRVPDIPYEPRLALSTAETVGAAERMMEKVKEAARRVEEKPSKANIRDLMNAIDNSTPNVEFATKSLTNHVENVVTKAKADIEGMVIGKAAELGLTAADVPTFALEGPQED